MTADEIKAAVMGALPLRPPRWKEVEGVDRVPPPQKIAELEDYLMQTAFVQAELEEALFYIDAVLEQLKTRVAQMTGWEALLPPKRRERITQAEIAAAKRKADPTTFELGAEMRLLRATGLRQIDRMRYEAQFVISRAYTMISGS